MSRSLSAAGGLSSLFSSARYIAATAVTRALPRKRARWVFGSGERVAPDLLEFARSAIAGDPGAEVVWLTAPGGRDHAPQLPPASTAVQRDSWRGFLATATAGHAVTANGLSDLNTFGVFHSGAIQLTDAASRFTRQDPISQAGPGIVGRIARKINKVHRNQLSRVIVPDAATAATARAALGLSPGRVRIAPNSDAVNREITDPTPPDAELVKPGGVFFESFYGRQVTCNPLALDREIATRFPDLPRQWSVLTESQPVPDGAQAVVVGSPEWFAARRSARLLIVNDWLRFGFRSRPGQTVLQTWHGTMLKALALAKPDLGWRSRRAVRAESARWDIMLAQNPHSAEQFRTSYAFTGPIIETGYPRDDELVRSLDTTGLQTSSGWWRPSAEARGRACEDLGVDPATRVMAYVPTWRYSGEGPDELLDLDQFARELGPDWTILVRGHTRATAGRTTEHGAARNGGAGTAPATASAAIVDASDHPNVNTVFLAADVLVTDFSSVMFDAALTGVPMVFFAPDGGSYARDRGFTFDFPAAAPGPIVDTPGQLLAHLRELADAGPDAAWLRDSADRARAWRERFLPHDDGHAAQRVVDELITRGLVG